MSHHEGFHDYTLATPWERLVAVIEQSCRSWLLTGLDGLPPHKAKPGSKPTTHKVQAKLSHRLPWRREHYLLTLYIPPLDPTAPAPRRKQQQQAANITAPVTNLTTSTNTQPSATPTHAPALPASSASKQQVEDPQPRDASTPPPASSPLPANRHAPAGSEHNSPPGLPKLRLSALESATSTFYSPRPDGSPLAPSDNAQPTQELTTVEGEAADSEEVFVDVDGSEGGLPAELDADMDRLLAEYRNTEMQLYLAHSPRSSVADTDSMAHTTEGQDVMEDGASTTSTGADDDTACVTTVPLHITDDMSAREVRNKASQGRGVPKESRCWWPLKGRPRQWWRYGRQHRLQTWFGVDIFLLLEPASYSGRVLDEQEANALVSALGVALQNTGISWPAFVPVHDALRDAFWGTAASPFGPVRFDTDSIHTSRTPQELTRPEGQLALFATQLKPYSPGASLYCRSLANPYATECPSQDYEPCSVTFTCRHVYVLPTAVADEDEAVDEDGGLGGWSDKWDDAAPWRPWASQKDPINLMELDVVWEGLPVELGNLPNSLDPLSAKYWVLHALQCGLSTPHKQKGFMPRSVDRYRQHVQLQREGTDWLWSAGNASFYFHNSLLGKAQDVPDSGIDVGLSSFTAMLHALLSAREAASRANSMGEMVHEEWWADQHAVVPPLPPEHVMQDVMLDLFYPVRRPSLFPNTLSATAPSASCSAGSSPFWLHFPGTAPPDCLVARLAQHCMVFGNARAIALLWSRFTQEVRFEHWDSVTLLPRLPSRVPPPASSYEHPPTIASKQTQAAIALLSSQTRPQSSPNLENPGQPSPEVYKGFQGQSTSSATHLAHAHLQNAQHSGPDSPMKVCNQQERQPTSEVDTASQERLNSEDAVVQSKGSTPLRTDLAAANRETTTPGKDAAAGTADAATSSSDDAAEGGSTFTAGPGSVPADADWEDRQHSASGSTSAPSAPRVSASAAVPAAEQGGNLSGTHVQQHSNVDSVTGRRTAWSVDELEALKQELTGGGLGFARKGLMGGPPDPDLHACLLHQKLQLLNVCIFRRNARRSSAHCSPLFSPASRGFSFPVRSTSVPEPQAASTDGWEIDSEDDFLDARAGSVATHSSLAGSDYESCSDDEGWDQTSKTTLPNLCRANAPSIPICVPETQEPPCWTADMLLAKQRVLEGLMDGTGSAPDLLLRLKAELLLSDMAAFKEANPECELQDFLAWQKAMGLEGNGLPDAGMAASQPPLTSSPRPSSIHSKAAINLSTPTATTISPATTPPATPTTTPSANPAIAPAANPASAAAAAPASAAAANPASAAASAAAAAPASAPAANPASAPATNPASAPAVTPAASLHRLWASTPACATDMQKPLLDVEREGEIVLHYLETLTPLSLFTQLFVVGMASAVSLLAQSRGAQLEVCRAKLEQFVGIMAPILEKGSGLAEALADMEGLSRAKAVGTRLGPGAGAKPYLGLDDAELEFALAEFQAMEQVVVLAESLVRRLPHSPGLCNQILQRVVAGREEGEDEPEGRFWCGCRVEGPRDRAALWRALSKGPRRNAKQQHGGSSRIGDLASQSLVDGGTNASSPWPATPDTVDAPKHPCLVQREWVLDCSMLHPRRCQPLRAVSGCTRSGSPPARCHHRLYVQEADSEMRLATLFTNHGP